MMHVRVSLREIQDDYPKQGGSVSTFQVSLSALQDAEYKTNKAARYVFRDELIKQCEKAVDMWLNYHFNKDNYEQAPEGSKESGKEE